MNFKIYSFVVFTLFAVVVFDPNGSCPDFSATFVMIVDQTIGGPFFVLDDPEQTFLKEIGFRDNDIQHALEDAIKFFNTTYGLDFSLSPPNKKQE